MRTRLLCLAATVAVVMACAIGLGPSVHGGGAQFFNAPDLYAPTAYGILWVGNQNGQSGTATWGLEYNGSTAACLSTSASTCFSSSLSLQAGQFISNAATGTAPLSVTSTTAVANLTAARHPLVNACGTASTCASNLITGTLIAYGTVTLAGGTATVTALPYTSGSSIFCMTNDNTTPSAGAKMVATSATTGTVTGTGSDTVSYQCLGH